MDFGLSEDQVLLEQTVRHRHRHRERAPLALERHDRVLHRHVGRDELDDLLVDFEALQADNCVA